MCGIHMFVCVCAYTQVHMPVWRPEVTTKCLSLSLFIFLNWEEEDRVSHLTLNSPVWQDMD